MPRIDPQQLLVCLTPLLAQNGGIKSPSEVIRLANLMEKYSKKLVSKCIYIQILKCTETELLGQFMAAGGWNLVHNWLRDGSESDNWPFVQELLEMLLLCPVDGNRLKSNHTPKIVKNLSLSCQHQHVKILSSKLVEQWLKIAHQEKQQLTASQTNGLRNGLNGIVNSAINHDTEVGRLSVDETSDDKKVNETVQNDTNGTVSDEDVGKKSSENIKYKISSKEGSGKLLLSLKRSTSPSVDVKEAKLSRSSSTESKSKSSSDKDKEKSKKSSSSSSHKSSGSSSSKSSHRDKERSSSVSSSSHHKSSSSSKDKHRESSKSSSSKSSSSKDKDKDKRKKDTEKSQAERDKETLNFLTPLSSSKLQRIPKRQHSENGENKSSESNKEADGSPSKIAKTEPVEKKKPSISIEVRKGEKPKTVKTLNSQFRNHGLAEEPPKPPSRRDLKKPATSTPALTVVTSLPSAKSPTSPPPSKKIQLEKVLDTENIPERVGGVKLIKPKPMLIESIGFMDALSASAVSNKKDPKKRKRLPSNSGSSKKDEPESPKIEAKPLKFYKDTLEEVEEESVNAEKSPTKDMEASADEKESATDKSPEPTDAENKDEQKSIKSPVAETDEPEEKRAPGIGCGPDGPPGVLVDPNVPRRKKRSIRWRPEEELTEIRFFELDETERTNVSKTFTEQKQMEHVEERNSFQLGRKKQSEDTMAEQTIWRALIIVDNVPEINYSYKSSEIQIQAEREKNVLQELYFRHSINDSPHEPDPESYEHIEPMIVPLDDVNNPDSINNFRDIQWPAPKGELPSTFMSNPFGNVFSGINIPPAVGVIPSVAINPIANPLASFNPLGLVREPPNPMMGQWIIPPAAFLQPPPTMMPQAAPVFAPNRGGLHNNNFRNNNSRPHNNGAGGGGGNNWVRGNSRRGICNQFRRDGFCRNKTCPYIHER